MIDHFKPYLKFNTIVIFITGGAVLSLELISSRIMTPYFGVSLYIWTGILSITLIALSIGYRMGGRISNISPCTTEKRKAYLEKHFFLMLAKSSVSLGITCIIYPWLFFSLAKANLIIGAFLASLVLLFIPLVSLSAMNPILIEIDAFNEDRNSTGQQAGNVFFISTVGSVSGVLVTAFLFVPNMTNYLAVLTIGIVLSILSIAGWRQMDALSRQESKKVLVLSIIGLVLCSMLAILSPTYLKKKAAIHLGSKSWKIEKEYTSHFGNVKVVSTSDEELHYYNDGTIQSMADHFGHSVSPYTYGTELLALGARPKARSALVVGLAGGLVPMRLAKKGLEVDVVEINPSSLDAAKEFFYFDESMVTVHLTDIRSFVKSPAKRYDIVVIDFPQGDAIPDYLLSREFYHDIKRCLRPDGLAVLNTTADVRFMEGYYAILKSIKSEFKTVNIFHKDKVPAAWPFTIYVAATNGLGIPAIDISKADIPAGIKEELLHTLGSPKPIDPLRLDRAQVITDEWNFFSFMNASYHLSYRTARLSSAHPLLLVN